MNPTYTGCSVCDEWLTFSNFKRWMEKQDWQGKCLDKDLLIPGNKVYSPDNCALVDAATNLFIGDNAASRGDFPIGVIFDKPTGRFLSRCRNPFTKKFENLGRFFTPEEANLAWRKRKHQLAVQLADLQADERVSKALKTRYL